MYMYLAKYVRFGILPIHKHGQKCPLRRLKVNHQVLTKGAKHNFGSWESTQSQVRNAFATQRSCESTTHIGRIQANKKDGSKPTQISL
jgi:hypothetical protein